MNKLVIGLVSLVVVLVVGFIFLSQKKTVAPTPVGNSVSDSEPSTETVQTASTDFTFANPKKSAHYETNTPSHGAILAEVPVNIVIDFNFDVAPPSEISIKSNGKEYGVGDVVIDKNKLALRKNVDPAAPDGKYLVSYNACWPDKTCHDGYFEFAIDRAKKSSFQDLRNKKEVVVDMKEIMFSPKDILISKGTKITWTNSDTEIHYVNTDSHPAHTYFLAQNSKALVKGEKYTLTFDTPGIYPYHCSAHEAQMKGSIIVE